MWHGLGQRGQCMILPGLARQVVQLQLRAWLQSLACLLPNLYHRAAQLCAECCQLTCNVKHVCLATGDERLRHSQHGAEVSCVMAIGHWLLR